MPVELADWNPAALRLLQRMIAAAAPFDTRLLGTDIAVSLEQRSAGQWPVPPPHGLSVEEHGPWPDGLTVRAEWAGGATSFRVAAISTGRRVGKRARYDGLVALKVETRTGGQLLWLNLPTTFAKEERDVVELCVLTALVKRQDNSEQTQALANLARNAGLSFGSRKKVSLGRVRVPSGELVGEPAAYWRNLIVFCLLKLPFFSDDRRDFDGTYFIPPHGVDDEAAGADTPLETVTGTTHIGLMVPVLGALTHGPVEPGTIENSVLERYGDQLTAGDRRRKSNGTELWRYNTRWALSQLKQRGEAENPVRGQWNITAAGRKRLEQELEGFDLRRYQTLRSKVRPQESEPEQTPIEPRPESLRPPDHVSLWQSRLSKLVETSMLERLSARVRPDLGPTPTEAVARNVIFVGPPGTGKTWTAEKVAHALTGETPSTDGRVRLVQFHPSYGYEDFVWSIRPVLSGESAGFRESPGPFMTICKDAADDPDEFYVLIIDEINRGDPARIFGELLYALEYRGREILLAGGGAISVPPNLVVLGTMNSVDRSVGMIDYALRRRFAFLRVEPSPALISKFHGTKASFVAAKALQELNRAIRELGDAELQLGHSYFMSAGRTLASDGDLDSVWTLDLQPQLAELFHGRGSTLDQLTRVWRETVHGEHSMLPSIDAEEDEEDEDDEEATAVDAMQEAGP